VTLPPATAAGSVLVEVISTTVAAERYAVTVSPPAPSALSGGAEAAASYPAGSVLQLTAVPNAGYAFVEWGGALRGATNPQRLTVTGPLTITATFKVADVLLPIVAR
jgi:hypothetical protein